LLDLDALVFREIELGIVDIAMTTRRLGLVLCIGRYRYACEGGDRYDRDHG